MKSRVTRYLSSYLLSRSTVTHSILEVPLSGLDSKKESLPFPFLRSTCSTSYHPGMTHPVKVHLLPFFSPAVISVSRVGSLPGLLTLMYPGDPLQTSDSDPGPHTFGVCLHSSRDDKRDVPPRKSKSECVSVPRGSLRCGLSDFLFGRSGERRPPLSVLSTTQSTAPLSPCGWTRSPTVTPCRSFENPRKDTPLTFRPTGAVHDPHPNRRRSVGDYSPPPTVSTFFVLSLPPEKKSLVLCLDLRTSYSTKGVVGLPSRGSTSHRPLGSLSFYTPGS